MNPVVSAMNKKKSLLGVAAKKYKSDPADLVAKENLAQARRELAEEKIRSYVEKTVADSPPLTPDQLARLALLLQAEVAS